MRSHRRGQVARGIGEDASQTLTNIVFQVQDEAKYEPEEVPKVQKKKKKKTKPTSTEILKNLHA